MFAIRNQNPVSNGTEKSLQLKILKAEFFKSKLKYDIFK